MEKKRYCIQAQPSQNVYRIKKIMELIETRKRRISESPMCKYFEWDFQLGAIKRRTKHYASSLLLLRDGWIKNVNFIFIFRYKPKIISII